LSFAALLVGVWPTLCFLDWKDDKNGKATLP
jgi:hypothetical protein